MTSKLKSTVSKTSGSGLNVVVVPVRPWARPMARDRPGGLAAHVRLRPDLAVAHGLDGQRLRERVDDADADAVEAAGDLVAATAELAAGVEHGVHHLEGVLAGLLLAAHGHAAAVVGVADGAVGAGWSPRCSWRGRPWPRRWSCRRPPRRGGAGREHRSSRCTCPAGAAPPRDPRGPGWSPRCMPPAWLALPATPRRSSAEAWPLGRGLIGHARSSRHRSSASVGRPVDRGRHRHTRRW